MRITSTRVLNNVSRGIGQEVHPQNPDYHFLLSKSFFLRGSYDEAKKVMLESKALMAAGAHANYPIDENLSKIDKYIAILQQVNSDPQDPTMNDTTLVLRLTPPPIPHWLFLRQILRI